jgi:hypothetical protein
MPNWTESMQQTFEFYTVDPGTWKDVKLIDHVISCTIDRDTTTDTLESASFELGDDVGETYIRVYLIAIQNGVKEKHPLGTFLVQTIPTSFDGRTKKISADAYSPLIELNEKYPPFGFCVNQYTNIMDQVYMLTRDNVRAPVVKPSCGEKMFNHFVADSDDKWLPIIKDLMTNAKYIFNLDEISRILFSPKQELEALQPVWTFDDSNSSILYPDMDSELDLYGIPNVVEVMYSDGVNYQKDGKVYYARVVNDDPDSPTSTVRRGREIVHRVTDPSIIGNPTDDRIKEYAELLLKELSTVERTISYTHGYCPVRAGDCVRINYERAGITDVKARVVSQRISCVPGTPVSETAVYTKKYWR